MAESGTVLVTGAGGYIARHIVFELLRHGLSVRGSLRNRADAEEIRQALKPKLAAADLDRLSFVALDLNSDAGWPQALAGVDALVHTASPFPAVQPRDPQQLSRPAVEGTLRALEAARAAGVRRVVLTSSVAAIAYGPPPAGRRRYDERDWSDPDDPRVCNAYSRSKTLAERAAWALARESGAIELTAINPGLVLGPPLGRRFGTSLSVIERLLARKDPLLPNVGFMIVDVADVARLHAEALFKPASIGRRIVAADRYMTVPDMAETLKDAFPDRRFVTRTAPDWMVRLLARIDRSVATILPDLGRPIDISADATRALFGMEFIPAPASVVTSARALLALQQAG